MTVPITYSLCAGKTNSDAYYQDIALFTDKVLTECQDEVRGLAETYRDYLISAQKEDLRSVDEYLLEIILLGVFWKTYGDRAIGLSSLPKNLLSALGEVREVGGVIKSSVDRIRGMLITLFLLPDPSGDASALSVEYLDQLLGWMRATGDFSQETKRLEGWKEYAATLDPEKRAHMLASALVFAEWFAAESLVALGKYTENVESFLSDVQPHRRWREDVISCGRARVEYHMNMVGAEIMSRAYRDAFKRMPQKEVLLPGCMRANPKGCQLEETKLGPRCTGCTAGCRIHQITQQGKRHGFGVIIILHTSELFKGWPQEEIGIVGVACVPGLLAGGYKAKSKGVPPMCVLLDECGCSAHWHSEGIRTDINLPKLWELMGIPVGPQTDRKPV